MKHFFRKNNEMKLMLFGMVVLLLAYVAEYFFDIRLYGPGVFQKLILAWVFLCMILPAARLIIKQTLPEIFRYMDVDNEETEKWAYFSKKELTILGFSFYGLVVWALVYLAGNL